MSLISGRESGHAHRLVAATIREMAMELYDHLMSGPEGNRFMAAWRSANPEIADQPRQLAARFCARVAPDLAPQARATIAGMLARATDPVLAETLYEALCLDNTLRPMQRADAARALGLTKH